MAIIVFFGKFIKNPDLSQGFFLERVGGIEPPSSAWKADIKNHYTIPARFINIITELRRLVNWLFCVFHNHDKRKG